MYFILKGGGRMYSVFDQCISCSNNSICKLKPIYEYLQGITLTTEKEELELIDKIEGLEIKGIIPFFTIKVQCLYENKSFGIKAWDRISTLSDNPLKYFKRTDVNYKKIKL